MMNFEYIILFIIIDWIFKAVFSEWLYPYIDAKLYAGIYENKIKRYLHYSNKFWKWLFKEQDIKIFKMTFEDAVPRYRVFQKIILLGYWITAHFVFYKHFTWWVEAVCLFGVLAAYYFMKFERKYYYWAGQEKLMYEYQINNVNVFWLKRIYFSGYWLFRKGFIGWKFDLSSAIGTTVLYLSTIVFLIYYIIKII